LVIGSLILHLSLPGIRSLKSKRSILKPLLHRIHRQFNVSSAEIERNDDWDEAIIACVCVGNENGYIQRMLQSIVDFIPPLFPNVEIIDHRIELI
jgi:uncharacterized protein YlxP (DUF503 family)